MFGYFVYVLKSTKTRHYYVGQTSNPKKRLVEHNLGRVYWTKRYKPWVIIYSEGFKTREEAAKKEKYFKSHAGRTWLKRNLVPVA